MAFRALAADGARGVPVPTLGGCAALWCLSGHAHAQNSGEPYIGASGAPEGLGVFYEKTVDNTDPRNVSPSRGRVYRADDTAHGAAFGGGFFAGYRQPLGPGGFLDLGTYVSAEVDVAFHGGGIRGRLEGDGFSEGRNQLGESWPEDWFFEPKRSYGFTVHLGTGFGSGGARVYALAGVRRLEVTFNTDYTGCFNTMLCTVDEFVTGTNVHDDDFIGWAAGAGWEKTLGNTASGARCGTPTTAARDG